MQLKPCVLHLTLHLIHDVCCRANAAFASRDVVACIPSAQGAVSLHATSCLAYFSILDVVLQASSRALARVVLKCADIRNQFDVCVRVSSVSLSTVGALFLYVPCGAFGVQARLAVVVCGASIRWTQRCSV